MFDCNPVSDPVRTACDWPGKLRAYPWWPGIAVTHWHGRSRTEFNSIHLLNAPFFLSVWSVNILIYQVQLNIALILPFLFEDKSEQTAWQPRVCPLVLQHRVSICPVQPTLSLQQQPDPTRPWDPLLWVSERFAGCRRIMRPQDLRRWRAMCWTYRRYFSFWGQDLSWQDLRVSPLLASGRKYQRSETSLSKSLGKGIIRAIWHPRRGLCS